MSTDELRVTGTQPSPVLGPAGRRPAPPITGRGETPAPSPVAMGEGGGEVSPAQSSTDWLTPLLAVIFFVSGASGLIYQIAWVRLLSLTFGVTIYAISVVVATFMAGLAVGSFLGGRLADRVRYSVIAYAVVELAIAGLGAKSVDALDWVQATYLALQPRDADQAVAEIVALRFLLAGAVILVPTALMGATLPLMVRGSLSLAGRVGSRVSWLYASNTSGAILGCLLAGFVLIGGIGLRESIWVAAGLNAAAGFAALTLGIVARHRLRRAPIQTTNTFPPAEPSASQAVRVAVVAAFAVQGFVSLAYEVVWTRIFAVLLDGTSYAFTLVLAAVLFGIALGSALVGPLLSRPLPWPRVYVLLQTAVGVLGLAGVIAVARIYGISGRLEALPGLGVLMQGQLGWMAGTVAVVVLPVMLLLGASFPIAARIVVPDRAQAGRALGLLYASNTAGAILGATLAGFFLLPSLGSQRTIELLGAANLAIACLLAAVVGWRKLTASAAGAAVLVAAAVAGNWVPSMYEHMLAGRFPGQTLVWVGEGLETTITVVRNNASGALVMYFNGQSQASTDPGVVRFHRLLAHLPMALHPDPQDVLIIGLGGGTTASALAAHHPRRLDIVELSEITSEGARFFSEVNGDMLSESFVHLRIDDGRNYLLLTDRKYDVVEADVLHPRTAGTALLYSYDFFHQVEQALKPGGLMAQWLKYEGDYADNDNLRHLITRSFAAAFPYVTLWQDGALLIGSNQPIDPWDPRLDARWTARRLGVTLADIGVDTPDALREMYLLSDPEVRAWAGDGPIMTDDHPYGEFFLSLPGGTLGAY